MSALLVQGFFFQWNSGLDIAYRPEEGAVPVIRTALTQSMFAGAIWTEPESDQFVGHLSDRYGEATIFNISLTDQDLIFDKKYEHRKDVIHYILHLNGLHWIGEYSGEATGNGLVRCILTRALDFFFNPAETAKDLGKPEFLEPPVI